VLRADVPNCHTTL